MAAGAASCSDLAPGARRGKTRAGELVRDESRLSLSALLGACQQEREHCLSKPGQGSWPPVNCERECLPAGWPSPFLSGTDELRLSELPLPAWRLVRQSSNVSRPQELRVCRHPDYPENGSVVDSRPAPRGRGVGVSAEALNVCARFVLTTGFLALTPPSPEEKLADSPGSMVSKQPFPLSSALQAAQAP